MTARSLHPRRTVRGCLVGGCIGLLGVVGTIVGVCLAGGLLEPDVFCDGYFLVLAVVLLAPPAVVVGALLGGLSAGDRGR